MKISIVIPAYNAENTIASCLEAIRQQTIRDQFHEVIVVDNNSADKTVEIAQGFEEATVLVQPKKGAAAARNMGLAHSSGDIVCFTDADCSPIPTWAEELVTALEQNRELLAVKGAYLTDQTEIPARFVQIEYEDKYDRMRPHKYLNFIDTYSAAFWRDILYANDKGFDEGISYAEDRELAFRLASRGYKMAFRPDAIVYHKHSYTHWGYFKKKFFNGYYVAPIVKRYPQRGVADSHTPQVQKVQMGLILLLVASIIGLLFIPILNGLLPTLWWGWIGFMPIFIVIAFLISTIPFVIKAWKKDPVLALASPHMLFLRAAALSFGYVWGMLSPPQLDVIETSTIKGVNYFLKRGLDIVGAIDGILLTVVLFPLILVSAQRPLITKQKRLGAEGKPFNLISFRLAKNSWLERQRFDKLPQFWNVLKGEMSLVGPPAREIEPSTQQTIDTDYQLAIKPGMINPSKYDQADQTAIEDNYIENYILWTDLALIFKSIPKFFQPKH